MIESLLTRRSKSQVLVMLGLERAANAKQLISSRFTLIRFAASCLVTAGYRFNRG